ncbi:beta/alpha barrel domain-containing protein [Gehongia tenuis]|uniref:Uncharacterized protein n=1 Tax=Gehongia tenuis TaxID=2763655 RepID=A0A926HQN8_9FIRM|nr:hypothetical protein [Gehongia tenuis]MBC8531935.1 hypothetical protein [Gehongia tenuis]
MAYLEKLTSYKTQLLDLMWNSAELKALLAEEPLTREQFDSQVHGYDKNPETLAGGGVHLMVEINPVKAVNATVMDQQLVVRIVVPEAKVKADTAIRTDEIARILDELIAGNTLFGAGAPILDSAVHYQPAPNCVGRTLLYTFKAWNRRRKS